MSAEDVPAASTSSPPDPRPADPDNRPVSESVPGPANDAASPVHNPTPSHSQDSLETSEQCSQPQHEHELNGDSEPSAGGPSHDPKPVGPPEPPTAQPSPPSSSPSSSPGNSPAASTSTAPSSTRTSLASSAHSASTSHSHSHSHSNSNSNSHSHSHCKPGRTGILRSPTLPAGAPAGVTFAPLPQIDARKRTSGVPLGVAARSRMLRARRVQIQAQMQMQARGEVDALHAWPAGEARLTLEQLRALEARSAGTRTAVVAATTAGTAGRRPHTPYVAVLKAGSGAGAGAGAGTEDTVPEEDALIALGRMVKGGARTLWRRVSHSQLKEDAKEQGHGKDGGGGEGGGGGGGGASAAGGGGKMSALPLQRSVSLSEPRVLERCASGEDGLTVSVLVKEPAALFDEQEELGRRAKNSGERAREEARPAQRGSVDAVKVTEHVHGGVSQEEEHDGDEEEDEKDGEDEDGEQVGAAAAEKEEQGRVWEEVVTGEVQRRMEAIALSKAHDREHRPGLVERLASLRGLRARRATKPR